MNIMQKYILFKRLKKYKPVHVTESYNNITGAYTKSYRYNQYLIYCNSYGGVDFVTHIRKTPNGIDIAKIYGDRAKILFSVPCTKTK